MARTKQIKPETQFFPKRIMKQLNFIKGYPLTLVEAPSGFGKTTVLRHFFDSQVSASVQVCWHTFATESPNASWETFCKLVATFDPDTSERLMVVGAPNEDTLPEICEIFEELCCSEEIYMVLDDFVTWKLPNPGEFLMALSAHGGLGLHVVVASQLLPGEIQNTFLPNSHFLLLRESVLTFSDEDINVYYRQAGVLLTKAQLEEVSKMTEGWIMAVYLQLLFFIENGRFGECGMESLIQEALWNRLSEKERKFLLCVSIFPRFSLQQAIVLSDMSAYKTEYLLQRKRLFVHFDRESRRFYFHNLFKNFLTERFTLLPEAKKRVIYLVGGNLAEQAGDRVNTVRFYYFSQEWERLLALPLTSYEIADVIDETTKPMILDIIEYTPFEIKLKYPASMVALAFTLFFLNENEKLLAFKKEIDVVIAKSELSQAQKNGLQGEMELLMSFLEYNNIDAMSKRHRRALELLEGPASLINIKSTWTFGSPSVLYMFYREIGKLDEELVQMDECMTIYYILTGGHGSGAEIIMRAEAHLMRGELEEAEILCHKAMFTADSKSQNSIVQCSLFLLARIAIFLGDKSMLQNTLKLLEERSRQNTEDLCRYTLDLAKGYLFLLLKRTDDIATWLVDGEITDKRLIIMTQPFAHILYERILLERGEYQKLLGVSEFSLGLSFIFPNLLPQIYIKLYISQALKALGKGSKALENLNDALAIALPDRIYLPFAENYEGIKKLLPDAVCESEVRKKIGSLAGVLKNGLSVFGRQTPTLSSREREVLLLIEEGMTNPMIAKHLYVSISTVKATVSSILSKKGVSSREFLKSKNRKINGHRSI